ncbi:MAG: undecaprenyl-diphosphate phosphatase [Deltaproteobacteria bacterium]|nr:undecaprenyl-diphosphate phosphatase [Deltaproteobacteria bacterium]
MQDWVVAIILGVVEGITEFIPVSSTGHLLLAEHMLHVRKSDLFNVVIQAAAAVAVLPLFKDRLRQLSHCGRDALARDFAVKVAAAFAVTGAGGVMLEKLGFRLPERAIPVAFALLIGGAAFIAVERWLKGREPRGEITWTIAVAVGLAQLLAAVFPGTSRSGATILLMLAMGLGRPAATEFSFLVGIPTLLAAAALKIAKAVVHPSPGAAPESLSLLLLASAVSAAVSFVAVRWLLRFVQTHTFTGFGWYRIAAGAVILAVFLA